MRFAEKAPRCLDILCWLYVGSLLVSIRYDNLKVIVIAVAAAAAAVVVVVVAATAAAAAAAAGVVVVVVVIFTYMYVLY